MTNLRPLRLLLLISCTTVFLSSCCTKKYCDSDEEIEEVFLKNFTPDQTDTVRLYSYVRNTGLVQPVDSLMISAEPGSGGRYVLHVQENFFTLQRDYKVKIPATGLSYNLTGFETSSEKCNVCFFTKDTYPQLSAYRINGVRRNGKTIEITP